MKRSQLALCGTFLIALLLCVAVAGFYAGKRSVAQEPDVFTWLLMLDANRKVYETLEGEPSLERLSSARWQLLMAMGTAAEVLRTHPEAVESRFGKNSAQIYKVIDRAEAHLGSTKPSEGAHLLVLDAKDQVLALQPFSELQNAETSPLHERLQMPQSEEPVGQAQTANSAAKDGN